MKLRFEELPRHLEQKLLPIYLISGDEPLQLGEAADAVRAAARRHGYSERQVMHAEGHFDWGNLAAASDSLSLFAERRIIDLRLSGASPGDAGSKALTAYAARPPEDSVLLISAGKLDKKQQASKWFKALDQIGATVQVWPVDQARLPQWIGRRMRAVGLEPQPEAVQLIADRVEGNLLAAAQEVEKLRLLVGSGTVDIDTVSQAVGDSSRFDVFELADTALAGDGARAARIVQGLRGEGIEPVLVLWALARELRTLALIAEEMQSGLPAEQAIGKQRVWEKRKPLFRAALERHGVRRWQPFLVRAGRIDRIIKGIEPGNAWDELIQLATVIAGVRVV